ncbi:MAG: peptidylprolyl isomerase [Terracidiphilus sp.]|nr:peptidylprolyl isomerase [Terracidiphilus sp.]
MERRLQPGLLFAALAGAVLTVCAAQAQQPVMLDRVVAVVNNRAILASDLRAEMRMAVLTPPNVPGESSDTPHNALERLISRALIIQQIRADEVLSTRPTNDQVAARLAELRKELPECVRMHCTTDDGWKEFLQKHELTERQVTFYLRSQLELLRFIELRFRQGIQISNDEVQSYYINLLVPQYLPGQKVPTLDQVAPRIEEILLQQKVNAMFSDWLDNLRKQGEIEVLDPSLEPSNTAPTGASKP